MMPAMNAYRGYFLPLWFIVVVIAWVGPTLIGRAIYAVDSDLVLYYYPIFHFYSAALHAGQSFLWLPGIFTGFPVYLSQSAGLFDPINIFVFSIWSGFTGMHIRLVADLLLTLLLSFLAARALGLSRVASALVGPSYLLAFHLRFLSNPVITNTLFLLPLLIYTTHSVIIGRMRVIFAALLAGIGIGWALLSGYAQLVVYAIFLAGVYALVHLVLVRRDERWSRWMRMCVYGSIMLIVGTLVALPFLLPAWEFLPLSARAIAAPSEFSTLKTIEPGDLILAVLPDYFYVPYVTSGRKPLFVGAFFFLLALGAAILAARALHSRATRQSHRTGIALTAAGGTALVAAFKWSPLFAALGYVPVLGLFRFPFRFMFLGAFFIALLGGIGFDRLHDLARDSLWRGLVYVVSGFALVFSSIVVFVNMSSDATVRFIADTAHALLGVSVYGRAGFTKETEAYRAALENGLFAMREILTLSNSGIAIGLGLLVASCAMLIYIVRRGIDPRVESAAAGLVACTCLLVPMTQWDRFVPRENIGVGEQIVARYSPKKEYRIFSFIPTASVAQAIPPQYKLSDEEERAVQDVAMRGGTPNVHLYHSLGSIDGYDQFEPAEVLRALEAAGAEYAAGYGAGTYEERTARLLSKLDIVGMMGARYIISGVDLKHPDLRLLGTESISSYAIPLRIYEYAKARPIFYLAGRRAAVPHDSFSDLEGAGLTFADTVYLDCGACESRARADGSVELVTRANGLYEFEVRAASGDFLVLSESFLPGWRGWIDGETVELVRANGLFMAVKVPAGEHHVRFEYQGQNNELPILKALQLVRE